MTTAERGHFFGDLHGRRALITGASSGIGRAVAVEFARAGADVILHAHRSRSPLEAMAEEFESQFATYTHIELADCGDPIALEAFADRAWEHWGGLDIVAHVAGVDLLTGEAAKLDYATKLQRLFEVDLRSTLLLTRTLGERMQAAGSGVILTVGWDQADRGMEGFSGELFSATKNAIMGFTRSLAVSLAPQVRVNCIAPGWIKTAWGEHAGEIWQERVRRETPLQRWGLPEDIAKLARFLVSDDAAYLTGQVINANGGAVR